MLATEDVRIVDDAEVEHGRKVAAEVARLRVRREAERVLKLESAPARPADVLLDDVQILAVPEPPMLVSGRLPADALALLIAPSGLGKSLVALGLGVAVASGPKWLGASVTNAGSVLWVLAEGGVARFARRLRAAKLAAGLPLDRTIGLHTWPRPVALLDPADVAALVAAARVLQPRLTVFDTYSRCAIGADENSSQDTGRIIGALDEVRQASGGLVLGLHHLPKDGRLEPRGSTALGGAVDTIATLSRVGESRIRLACSKQRDGEPFPPLLLELVACDQSVVPRLAAPEPAAAPADAETLDARLLAALATKPRSGSCLAKDLREDRGLTFSRLRALEAEGRVRQQGQGRSTTWSRA